jgi:hypothetical protein
VHGSRFIVVALYYYTLMSDRDRGAWRSDGVVALRCAVSRVLPAVEVRLAGFQGCVGVAGCWRWSNQTIFFDLFSRCPKRYQGRLSIVHYFDLLLEVYD